jgi:predicted transcriptional regulator
MKVLLSIKPEFANKIFVGEKKFEFRKSIFKEKGITKVIVYASSPISMIIGEFEISKIIFDDIPELWKKTEKYAGIDEAYFNSYFFNRDKGYAIRIKNARLYPERLCIKEKFGKVPPQSFAYVRE